MNKTQTANELVEPPEGVLAGESVPRENELDDRERMAVEALARRLKRLEGYADLSDDRREEIAREKLQREGVIR